MTSKHVWQVSGTSFSTDQILAAAHDAGISSDSREVDFFTKVKQYIDEEAEEYSLLPEGTTPLD